MDTKLTMLFLLIGAVIGLSHFGGENIVEMKYDFDKQRLRTIA
jgi:hypothetical protein